MSDTNPASPEQPELPDPDPAETDGQADDTQPADDQADDDQPA